MFGFRKNKKEVSTVTVVEEKKTYRVACDCEQFGIAAATFQTLEEAERMIQICESEGFFAWLED